MARTISSNPRSAPCSTAQESIQTPVIIRAAFILLVFAMPSLLARVHLRDAEVSSEFVQLIRVDGALNTDDGQLLGLRYQDGESADLAVLRFQIHFGVLAGFDAAHADN